MSPPTQAWGPWPDGDAGGHRPAPEGTDHAPGHGEGGRAQTVGEILEGAIKTVLSGPRVLVGGAFLVVGGVQAIVVVAVWLLAGDVDLANVGTTAADATIADLERLSGAAAVALLGSWTVSVAMTALGAAAVAEWSAGRPITFASVAPRVRRRLGRLVLALVIAVGLPLGVGVAVAATAILLAITLGGITGLLVGLVGVSVGIGAGLWLAIRLVLSPVAAVLGSGGTAGAVRESWGLTGQHFWRVLGFIALNVLLTQTVTAVVAAPLGVIVSENPEAFSGAAVIGGAVTSAVAVTLTAPFTACVTSLLFLDLRQRN